MALSSLINFASISNVQTETERASWVSSMVFGIATFLFSITVLVLDRSQWFVDAFNFSTAWKGKVEGYTLLFSVVWWVVAVGITTQVNGIAYRAFNIYFTSWLSLVASIYTLNKWSSAKDVLSIGEMTGLSATLKTWYLLFLSSLVVLGTSCDMYRYLYKADRGDASYGVAMGVVSTLVSAFWIFVHYDFFPRVEEGGWLELSSSFFLILLWIVSVAVMTQDQGIAATVTGTQLGQEKSRLFNFENCTVLVTSIDPDDETKMLEEVVDCDFFPRQIPGSNLYFAAWTCFLASVNVTFRWKAAQAIQFAQAQQKREQDRVNQLENDDDGDDDDDALDDV